MHELDHSNKLVSELRERSNTIIDRYKDSRLATLREGGTLVIQHPNGDSLHRDGDGAIVFFFEEWEMFTIDSSGKYTTEADSLRDARDRLLEFEQALSNAEP